MRPWETHNPPRRWNASQVIRRRVSSLHAAYSNDSKLNVYPHSVPRPCAGRGGSGPERKPRTATNAVCEKRVRAPPWFRARARTMFAERLCADICQSNAKTHNYGFCPKRPMQTTYVQTPYDIRRLSRQMMLTRLPPTRLRRRQRSIPESPLPKSAQNIHANCTTSLEIEAMRERARALQRRDIDVMPQPAPDMLNHTPVARRQGLAMATMK